MRLGIFGGSFDPVHAGHLLLGECCREQAGLDSVLFIPAHTPPHKQTQNRTPAEQRIDMLKLAISGNDAFRIDTCELNRGGVSYTVETLENLQKAHPSDQLFLMMGADSLAELHTWKEPKRICELASLLVVRRAGSAEPDWHVLQPFMSESQINATAKQHIEMPLIGLSSREIRGNVAAGKSIRYRVPRAVEMYIQMHNLYKTSKH